MDPLASLMARAGVPGLLTEERAPYLTPEEEQSVVSSLGGVGLSGLQLLGGILDTPGAAVRGALSAAGGGEFGNLFSLEDRVYGRDLLRQWGMADTKDNWGNFAGGLAIDIATDPLTWFSGGSTAAAKTAGRAAKKIDVFKGLTTAEATTKNLSYAIKKAAGKDDALSVMYRHDADVALRGMGVSAGDAARMLADDSSDVLAGTLAFGVPFMNPLKTWTPTGSVAALDKMAHTARYGKIPGLDWSPGETVSQLFDTVVRDRSTGAVQDALRRHVKGLDRHQSQILTEAYGDLAKLDHAAIRQFIDPDKLRSMAEFTGPGMKTDVIDRIMSPNAMDDLFEAHKIADPQARKIVEPILNRWHSSVKEVLEAQLREGIDRAELLDPTILYGASRQAVEKVGGKAVGTGKALSLTGADALKRQEMLKEVGPTELQPGGTTSLNNMFRDKALKTMADNGGHEPISKIMTEYLYPTVAEGKLADELIDSVAGGLKEAGATLDDSKAIDGVLEMLGRSRGEYDVAIAKRDQAYELTQFIQKLSKEFTEGNGGKGIGYYSNKIVDDLARTLIGGRDKITNARAIHTSFANTARRVGETPLDDHIPILEALTKGGITGKARHARVADGLQEAMEAGADLGLTKETADILRAGDDEAVQMMADAVKDQVRIIDDVATDGAGVASRVPPKTVGSASKVADDVAEAADDVAKGADSAVDDVVEEADEWEYFDESGNPEAYDPNYDYDAGAPKAAPAAAKGADEAATGRKAFLSAVEEAGEKAAAAGNSVDAARHAVKEKLAPDLPVWKEDVVSHLDEIPIKEGYVRLYHGLTRADGAEAMERIDIILKDGLKTGKELGHTIENAPVVFAGTEPMQFGKAGVAFDVPLSEVDIVKIEARVGRSILPSEIVGAYPTTAELVYKVQDVNLNKGVYDSFLPSSAVAKGGDDVAEMLKGVNAPAPTREAIDALVDRVGEIAKDAGKSVAKAKAAAMRLPYEILEVYVKEGPEAAVRAAKEMSDQAAAGSKAAREATKGSGPLHAIVEAAMGDSTTIRKIIADGGAEKGSSVLYKELADLISPKDIARRLRSKNKEVAAGARKELANMKVTDEVGAQISQRLQAYQSAIAGLDDIVVPMNVVEDAGGLMAKMEHPKALNPLIKAHDTFTNIFKANVTSPFMSFLTRNFTSLFWQDAVAGGHKNVLGMVHAWGNARGFVQGGVVKGAARYPIFHGMKLTDAQATDELRRMFAAGKTSPKFVGEASELVGEAAEKLDSDLLGQLFGGRHGQSTSFFGIKGVDEAGEYVVPGAWQKLTAPFRKATATQPAGRLRDYVHITNVRGGAGRAADGSVPGFVAAEVGQHLNSLAEDVGRSATFLRKMKEGASAHVASMESKLAHVEFGKLTKFEKKFMKRVVPWYSYSRHMAPYQLRTIAQNPGSSLPSLAIKASSTQGEFVPEQALGAVPWGEEVDGRQKFLKMDLPHEILNDLFSWKPTTMGTVQATGRSMLSQLHPLFKAPLEAVTDQSFFRPDSRGLSGMFSHLKEASGGTVDSTLLNHALMSSPVSRYVSTAVGLANPHKTAAEKAINLTTGVRINSVNVGAARDRAYSEAATNLMKEMGGRMLENIYLPKGTDLNEWQTNQWNMMKSLVRSIHGNAKDRATAQAAKTPTHNASL